MLSQPRSAPATSAVPRKPTFGSSAISVVMRRYCCKSLFASLIAKFPSCRRDVRINMWGPHHLVMNSPVTSVTGLRLYQSAIAPCFVFWRENSRTHFGTFATQSAKTGLMYCNMIGEALHLSLLADLDLLSSKRKTASRRPCENSYIREM